MSATKKAGRKPTDPATHRVHACFTLSPEVIRLLTAEAARGGESKSAVVERAIRRLAEREGVR